MMSKYEMPLAQPVMTATSHQATVFCILAQHDQCIPWLINNYISIFCLEKLYALPINRRGTLDFFGHYIVIGLYLSLAPILGCSMIISLILHLEIARVRR